MPQLTYQLLTLTSDLALNWPAAYLNTPVLLDINDINPGVGGYKIILPNAALVNAGMSVEFNNVGEEPFFIYAYDGTTLITEIEGGIAVNLYLRSNNNYADTNGTWGINTTSGVNYGINYLAATSSNNTITITGSPIITPGGTIDFALNNSLKNLNSITNTGFLVITNSTTDNLSYAIRNILGDGNISVTFPSGVENNPTISLSSSLSGLSSVTVGNLSITSDGLATILDDTPITIETTGDGVLNLNGVIIDKDANMSAIQNITISGDIDSPKVLKAYGILVDVDGKSPEIRNGMNISNITGGSGVYNVIFSTPISDEDYCITYGVGIGADTLPTLTHARTIYPTVTGVGFSFRVIDNSSANVSSVPYGVAFQVASNS